MATKASRTLSSVTTSSAVPLDFHNTASSPITVHLNVSGTNTSSVEGTLDDIQDSSVTPVWIALANLSGKTASAIVTLAETVRAVRLNCTAFTNGSVEMKVLQGDAI